MDTLRESRAAYRYPLVSKPTCAMPSAPMLDRRGLLFGALCASLSMGAVAVPLAPPVLRVGALRLASAGPLFIAQHEGYFRAQGLEVQIRYFDAAQPIALAATAGDVDLGVTAMTAGFFNIAGQGALKLIAGQAAIVKGHPGDVLMASTAAHRQGLRSARDLPGHSLGITQVGSSFHYELGLFAQAEGFEIQRVTVRPLQSSANIMAALRTGQVDSAIVSPQAAAELGGSGEAVVIGHVADAGNYRFGALFASTRMLAKDKESVRRFVGAYRRGAAVYHDAFFGSGAQRTQVALMIAQHILPDEPPSERVARLVAEGAYYVDANAPLDREDLQRQLRWFAAKGFINANISSDAMVDASFMP